MRMREKITEYTPEVKLVPGKTHYIADALKRSPLLDTNDNDYVSSCNYQSVKTAMDNIKEGAKSEKYTVLLNAVHMGVCGFSTSQYKTLIHRLSLRQINKVVFWLC